MGSDSRTASATSSNSRPKWRDKHLNQLSAEQLEEVKAHRSAGDKPDAFPDPLPGESAPSAVSESNTGAHLPRRQAGPDRNTGRAAIDDQPRDPSQQRDPRSQPDARSRDDRSSDHQHRNPDPQQDRRVTDDTHRGSANRLDNRDARSHPDQRPDQHQGQMRSSKSESDRIRKKVRDERYNSAPDQRDERQYDKRMRSNRDDEREHPVSGSSQSDSKVSQGFFARLWNFKPSRPVKYGLMALAIALMIAASFLKPIDQTSQTHLDSAFGRAMIGFGLARALNGVISVAQGTEFAVQPAGVGVNFSPGEILDPINDLVERFSWVMLIATSSLGIQKILLDISSWAGVSVLLAGAGLFFLLTRMRNSAIGRLADFASKLLLVMLLVRFMIPVGALASDWVYRQFLEPQYEQSSQQLELASERIKEISTRQSQQQSADSITDKAKNLYNSVTSKFDFDGMLDDYKQSAENVSENAINLIVVFVMQTIIFPLLFLFLIYRLFRSLLLPPRPR